MRPRVLILSWEYPPIVEGGLSRHVRKLAEGLVRDRHADVHVLTRGALGMPPHETRAGVRVHRVPLPAFSRDLDAFVSWVEGMNRDMLAFGTVLGERFRFDVVHGHDWLVAKAASRLARRYGLPYLTTVHATEHGRHQGWVDKHPQSYIHGVERWMVRTADGVIACSEYMRGHAAEVFGVDAGRIRVIPNGIDPEDLSVPDAAELAAVRARYAAPDEKLVVLVGRLVYEKGFQLALDALPLVLRRLGGGLRFVVAGTGTHETELREQAERLGLMEHGTFTGWTGDGALHALYRVADLCVVPSIYEPFGLVALEAMASGCACIVAGTGGLREVVPAAAGPHRVRPGDHRALARAMTRVLRDDELRERMIADAAEHIRRFDWALIAAETAEAYRELRTRPRALAAAAR